MVEASLATATTPLTPPPPQTLPPASFGHLPPPLTQCITVLAGSGLKPDVVRVITEELRKRLGLTLFGYDTVVQEGTGD